VEKVWNLYGPSESTVYSTGALQAPAGERPPGIGRPIEGTRAYVLDRGMELAPVGVPGELYLGGAGLARGYLGRPELTAERFRPDPWSGRPGERLYRTGDLVRYPVDGELEYLGRLDHQTKVRGFRVEPGEIEAVLAGHPEVAEAAVAVFGEEDKQLAAYVVTRQGAGAAGTPEIEELRGFLQARLPGHMVPAAFVFLPALPRSAVGKLDRKALPSPVNAFAVPTFVAPRSALESGLAAIWEQVLGVRRVGIHDNFFSLGGHSLKATQVLAYARDTFGVELPVRSLFESPTVAQLAVAVVKDLAGRAGREALSEAFSEVE
jgi:acyl carrier protein